MRYAIILSIMLTGCSTASFNKFVCTGNGTCDQPTGPISMSGDYTPTAKSQLIQTPQGGLLVIRNTQGQVSSIIRTSK